MSISTIISEVLSHRLRILINSSLVFFHGIFIWKLLLCKKWSNIVHFQCIRPLQAEYFHSICIGSWFEEKSWKICLCLSVLSYLLTNSIFKVQVFEILSDVQKYFNIEISYYEHKKVCMNLTSFSNFDLYIIDICTRIQRALVYVCDPCSSIIPMTFSWNKII